MQPGGREGKGRTLTGEGTAWGCDGPWWPEPGGEVESMLPVLTALGLRTQLAMWDGPRVRLRQQLSKHTWSLLS